VLGLDDRFRIFKASFWLLVKRGPHCGLQHQKEKRSVDYFAGLDVSVKETSAALWMMPARSCGSEGGECLGAGDHTLSLQARLRSIAR
jgi:hypothetical protein